MHKKKKIPDPTIERLPVYFRCLKEIRNSGTSIVSSDEIASRSGVKASQFRKDMSFFGEFGIQGLGYPVDQLLERLGSLMLLEQEHDVAIIGAGNLGTAFAKFGGFERWGFRIKHIFDNDPEKIGKEVGGVIVEDVEKIPPRLDVSIGLLTVPASQAQYGASCFCRAGVRAILNFTGIKLDIPRGIVIRNVDVTHELAILNYYLAAGEQQDS